MLTSLAFSELSSTSRAWFLDRTDFLPINLLVGKNASGKTRILNVISGFADVLTRRRANLYEDGDYAFLFDTKIGKLKYDVKIRNFRVASEILHVGTKKYIDRGEGGFGTIYSATSRRPVKFQTPDDQLAAVARQDTVQHPYLSELIRWADSVVLFKFGTDFGRQNLFIRRTGERPDKVDVKNTDLLAPIFLAGMKSFGSKFKSAIMKDMIEIGYDISDVGVRQPVGIQPNRPLEGPLENIFVREAGIEEPVDQIFMSQGMFRALSVVIQVNYSVMSKLSYCLLIDDIGEGLDYDRSTSLISMLVERGSKSNDQIIMTTNDRFVMNGVPLKYWSVIIRNGNRVHSVSEQNSPQAFKDFRYTGLSNFDFFASDFATR